MAPPGSPQSSSEASAVFVEVINIRVRKLYKS
jgi:hypothetical protein